VKRSILALPAHHLQLCVAHVSAVGLKPSRAEVAEDLALGGYVARCENAGCGHMVISYCSCRNHHCRKCHQGSRALAWMAERKAELLEVPYFHIVFTLPAEIGAIGYEARSKPRPKDGPIRTARKRSGRNRPCPTTARITSADRTQRRSSVSRCLQVGVSAYARSSGR